MKLVHLLRLIKKCSEFKRILHSHLEMPRCSLYNIHMRLNMSDKQIVDIIKKVLAKGHNVEIKKGRDGEIVILEIKRNKVTT